MIMVNKADGMLVKPLFIEVSDALFIDSKILSLDS